MEHYVNVRHIANQISFSYVFVRAAQKDYTIGNIRAGDESEAEAKRALLEAKRFQYQVGSERQLLLAIELRALQSAIDELALLRT